MKKILLLLALMVAMVASAQDDHKVITKNVKFSGQIEFVTKSKKIQGNPIWKFPEGTMWYLSNTTDGKNNYVDFYIETPDGMHREVMTWGKNEVSVIVMDPKTKPVYVVMDEEYSYLTILPVKDEKYLIQIVTQ